MRPNKRKTAVRYLYHLLSSPARERLLAVALATSVALFGCGEEKKQGAAPPPPKVSVVEVIEKDVPIYMQLVGQTRGYQDIVIRARVEGFVEAIHFKEGTEVEKGTLLYTIESQLFREKVAAAEGQLATARAQVAAAISRVAEAKAKLAGAEGDVTKFRPLAEIAAISRRDLDKAVAERDAAKERVEAAKGGVKAAQGQVDAARALLEANRIELGYTKVHAPVSGLIGKTKVEVGEFVGRPPLVTLNVISVLDPIHVEFSISERELLNLTKRRGKGSREAERRSGLEMSLADGSIHPYKGRVNFADRHVDPATGTLLFQASFPNPDKVVRPGQFARLRGLVETKKDALLLPQRAVQELQGKYLVYVVGPDNTAQVRSVTLGERVGNLWLVEKGLKPRERVIVEGIQRVRPGMKVSPKPAPSGAKAEGGAASPDTASGSKQQTTEER